MTKQPLDEFSDTHRFVLEACAVSGPTLVLVSSYGVVAAVFVVVPVLYAFDKHFYEFALFDALRSRKRSEDNEVVDVEVVDE